MPIRPKEFVWILEIGAKRCCCSMEGAVLRGDGMLMSGMRKERGIESIRKKRLMAKNVSFLRNAQ
jgi:hypothetical protein